MEDIRKHKLIGFALSFSLILACIHLLLADKNADKSFIKRNKKDIRDYTDAEIEHLFDEWEKNDEDEIPEDEKPDYKPPKKDVDFDELRKKSTSPDDLLRISKKGQSLMMFVTVIDRNSPRTSKSFTDKISSLWQTYLYNNHIDAQFYTIDDDRLLLMFKDGSQAWDSRDFLLKQTECKEINLEGNTQYGTGNFFKTEL